MKTHELRMENESSPARSVFECGSPLPLLNRGKDPALQSAGGLAQSKTWWLALLLCFIILHSPFCLRALGQSYSIDWYKVSGGGGTSTGGVYSVSGTIGQLDAGGPMTGGSYSLTGGFWALISVVQTPGAPTLYISHSGNTVTVYWQDVSGWSLQQNSNLATPAGWSVNSSWTTSNGTNYLNITPPTGNLFFRLKQ